MVFYFQYCINFEVFISYSIGVKLSFVENGFLYLGAGFKIILQMQYKILTFRVKYFY